MLVENSTCNRGWLKERLFREGLKHQRCEMCGQGQVWRGARLALILDHANGVRNDNRLQNLRILCPNCAATLDTHCGRSLRLEARDCMRCGRAFQPRHSAHRYCSAYCGRRWIRPRRGRPRPELRKVERPTHQQLRTDLQAMSFLAVGRKYGVSDNAVRKWLRSYERQGEEG